MISPTVDGWYSKIPARRPRPRVVTERTWDGAEVRVHGLAVGCHVTATVRASHLQITAVRDGQQHWMRRFDLPGRDSVRVKNVWWDGELVRVAVSITGHRARSNKSTPELDTDL